MKNSDWIKHAREHWPERSLERVLASNGCSSVLDLLKKKLDSKDDTALQTSSIPPSNDSYTEMCSIIRELEAHHLRYAKLDDATRQRLGRIPINRLDDARFWKDCVLKEIKSIRE